MQEKIIHAIILPQAQVAVWEDPFVTAVFGAVVGSVLGFTFAMLWDLYKSHINNRKMIRGTLNLLLLEMDANANEMKEILELLESDNNLTGKVETVSAPRKLTCTVHELAVSQLNFDTVGVDAVVALKVCHINITNINTQIDNREFYRSTNGAMSNYEQRRKLVNSEIISKINSSKDSIKLLRSEIAKLLSKKK